MGKYPGISHSALKRKGLSSHERHGGAFNVLLNKRSQSEKATSCVSSAIGLPGKGKTMETVKVSAAARAWEEGRNGRQSTRSLAGP